MSQYSPGIFLISAGNGCRNSQPIVESCKKEAQSQIIQAQAAVVSLAHSLARLPGQHLPDLSESEYCQTIWHFCSLPGQFTHCLSQSAHCSTQIAITVLRASTIMPREDNIEVHVQVNDKNLTEYIDPSETAAADGAKIFYIEAVSGQAFTVSAKFLAGFPLHNAEVLYLELKFDDSSRFFYRKREVCHLPKTFRYELTHDEVFDFKSCRVKDATGRWGRGIFTFGDLEVGKQFVQMDSRPGELTIGCNMKHCQKATSPRSKSSNWVEFT